MDTLSKTAVRSAEADRISSCQFADNVAQTSIDFFRKVCPENLADAYKQTVIATIVVQTPINSGIESDVESGLKILSLGVGTKVLNGNIISDERKTNMSSGDRLVRDCHAEVLARRGFVAYLYTELERLLADTNYCNHHNCIFEWSQHKKLQLKPGYTLHLYTSSQPCGNASNKKWAKCKAPPQYPNLTVHQFPTEVHNKIQITSRHEGQVAVLVKKNNYKVFYDAQTNSNSGMMTDTVDLNTQSALKTESLQATEQKEQHDTSTTVSHYQCLPGTAPVNSGEGNVMTCSDKISLWNVLGLQGSLLSKYFSPLHLSTITVGRKFSKIHAERALCCRLQEYCFPVTEGDEYKNNRKNKKVKINGETTTAPIAVSSGYTAVVATTISSNIADQLSVCSDVGSSPVDSISASSTSNNETNKELVNKAAGFRTVYKVNHPVMLSTKVKLDESAISTAPSTTTITAKTTNPTSTAATDNNDMDTTHTFSIVTQSRECTESAELVPLGHTATDGTEPQERASTTVAVGAQFTDWRSLCCWFHSNSSSSDSNCDRICNSSSISRICRENYLPDYQLEVIDGHTGLLYTSPEYSTAGRETILSVDSSLISQLSSYSFGAKYKALRGKFINRYNTSNNSNNNISIQTNHNTDRYKIQDNSNTDNHSINCIPFSYRDMKATGFVCSCATVSNISPYQQTISHTVDVQEVGKDSNNSQAIEVSNTTTITTTTTTISSGDVSSGGTVDMNIADTETYIMEHTAISSGDVSSGGTVDMNKTDTETYITEHTAAKRYLKSNDKFFGEWIQK